MVPFFGTQNGKMTKKFAVNNFICTCSFQFMFRNLTLENEDLVLKWSFYSCFFKVYEQIIGKRKQIFTPIWFFDGNILPLMLWFILLIKDKDNCTCGIFVSFRKVFDNDKLYYCILLNKLEYSGARGISDSWFA